MIYAGAILVGKIILMLFIIGAMVIILFGIGYLLLNDDLNTGEDDRILRDEVDNNEDVVSEKSIFYNFLVKKDSDKRRRP